MLEWSDIVLRLGVATLASGLVGLNRDLHGKPIGLRTLGLVGLATALAVMLASPAAIEAGRLSDATSRVIQGILTGIGFLGAGVIVHAEQHKVKGLTSAACVWFTACIGVVCGLGHWRLVAVALGFAFLVLVLGGPLERAIHRLFGGRNTDDLPPAP
ncbi:MgtC/SapB family protein [Bradyrhizobium sp. SYSU BS000235]|uniref:MgtC/SapB family protein n=1 Tax=Bradyrhizobium sp. SYSU BS000235 TaxID=3411332 RepID=UPI003C706568